MAVELPPVTIYEDGRQPPPDDPVSLPAPNVLDLPLPADVAKQKAVKTNIGFGDSLGTSDKLYQDFLAGKEQMIRDHASSVVDYQKALAREKAIQAMAAQAGPLDSAAMEKLINPFHSDDSADPSSVIERAYSTKYVSSMNTARGFMQDQNVLTRAAEEIPDQYQQAVESGNELLAKNQYILSKIQQLQQTVENQSWFGWGLDQAKQLTQFYPEYKERGLIDKTYFEGVGLGSNKEVQSNNLYRKPFGEFKQSLDKAVDYLAKDNPSLALSWTQSMYGQDVFQKTLDNAFSLFAIPDTLAVAKVAQKLLRYNQIRKATRDIVDSAARQPLPTRATMAEGAGDLGESAVVTVANNTMAAVAGTVDPIKVARQGLLSTWKQMADDFGANRGTYLSREITTRLQDEIEKDGGALLDKNMTMNRVERNPQAITEDVVRAYKDRLIDKYRGPGSTVLDVDGPFIEPASNTKWFRMHLGSHDGTLLSSHETAQGLADQLGIPAANIKSKPSNNIARDTLDADIARFENEGGFIKPEPDYNAMRLAELQRQLSTRSPKGTPKEVKGDMRKEVRALESGRAEAIRPPDQATIEQQGLGFYIEKWVPMKETDDFLRDIMIKDLHGNAVPEAISHSSSEGSKSIINSVLGWVRNSDETMSIQESAQRKAATYARSNLEQWAYSMSKDLNKLASKGSWWKPTAYIGRVSARDVREQFVRTLDHSKQVERWFKNPGELQDFYLRSFHRDPSELETKAYFNYIKAIEGDRMFGEIQEFKYRARVGAEQHQVRVEGPDGTPKYSDPFDGVDLKAFPHTADQILLMGKKAGEETVNTIGHINAKAVRELSAKVERGEAKVIELYDIDHHPLSNFSDAARGQRIRYVYSETVDTKPLQFNHVNKKEGGHFEWDYDHYLKQADIREQHSGKHLYIGDSTIMPISGRRLGENVAKIWNEAQRLIREGNWEGVRPLAAKLGIEHQKFTGWYKAGRDENGLILPAKLNANEPVMVVSKGKNIRAIDNSLQQRYPTTFVDGTKSGLANNFKVAYNRERHTDFDFRTINDIGTKGNPIYAYQPSKMVDPLTTMNRALNRAMNSAFMDDYKLYGIEHWLREAEQHLEVKGGIAEIRSSPFKYFNDPKYKADLPIDKKLNLESHRYKINTFVGIPSKFDTWVHTFTNHLADTAYSKYGPVENRNFAEKALSLTPIWLMHRITNPVDFIRSATFNFKLGLFNPAQFLVQAQTHALIWSLEPRHGTVGTYAMMLHGWSQVNSTPRILRALDNYATKLSGFGSKFKPGEFMEAREELEKTGFAHVAGEYENMSKAYLPTTNFLGGDISRGLRIGQTPFRLGEQSTRVTAWYTAFRKFREENPTLPIGNAERSQILNHADLLTVNMSRASSSAINHGVFSLSTQFLTYQIKLAELFWSKRIGETPAQRMMARGRLITGFSLLYGLPNAIGVTGAPVTDDIRGHLMDDLGYIPGEHWWSTMINEGYPAWQLSMITGHVENVGDRFGSQGLQNFKQGLRSDIPWLLAIGGAGVSTTNNFIRAGLDPFYQGMLSWARGDSEDERFRIRGADLVQPFKEISTVNQFTKWWSALESSKWISKNEQYVSDVEPLRATLLALTGMSPQEQDDMFIMDKIIKGETDAQKVAEKKFIKDWRRGLQAFASDDPQQGDAYIRNAISWLTTSGYQYDEILKIMAVANKGYESSIDASQYKSWTQGDRNKLDQRLERVQRQLDMKEKK